MKLTKKIRPFIIYTAILCLIVVLTLTCGKNSIEKPSKEAKKLMKLSEELQVKQKEIKAALRKMSISQLYKQLQDQSARDLEPFNSAAYHELVSRGTIIAPELKELISIPDRTSFLPLLTLREIDFKIYNFVDAAFRVQVLVESLKTSKNFNTWGIPHLYWESAAKAIIELGDLAVKGLIPLLEDKRPAPLWGSEEVMEYMKYQYRVCDYALAFINAINKQDISLPVVPEERDQLIEILLLSFKEKTIKYTSFLMI